MEGLLVTLQRASSLSRADPRSQDQHKQVKIGLITRLERAVQSPPDLYTADKPSPPLPPQGGKEVSISNRMQQNLLTFRNQMHEIGVSSPRQINCIGRNKKRKARRLSLLPSVLPRHHSSARHKATNSCFQLSKHIHRRPPSS